MAATKRRGGASASELATLRGELGERLARIEAVLEGTLGRQKELVDTLHAHSRQDSENFKAVTDQVALLTTDREVAKAVAKVEARSAARGPAAFIAALVGLLAAVAPKAAEALAAIIFGG